MPFLHPGSWCWELAQPVNTPGISTDAASLSMEGEGVMLLIGLYGNLQVSVVYLQGDVFLPTSKPVLENSGPQTGQGRRSYGLHPLTVLHSHGT